MFEKFLKHYGMPRRSGRYPWGSGEDPYQRDKGWMGHVRALRKEGLSDADIAKGEGMTLDEFRRRNSFARNEVRALDRAEALKLKDKGYSTSEIGRRMGKNESTIRSLLDPALAARAALAANTAELLKQTADKNRYIDVGAGVDVTLGVSATTLKNALKVLEEQGYQIHNVNVPSVGLPGKFTIVKVLGTPDTEWKEVVNDVGLIKLPTGYSEDFGETFKNALGLDPVKSVDLNRVQVRYGPDGGEQKDGVIELRRGVSDLDLGTAQYAQVRIAVNDTHFLKGMAIYSDNLPPGVDIVFNTNKSDEGSPLLAMKKMETVNGEVDPDNPFKSTIRRQNGALNIVNEEGAWQRWSTTISSQILSKQPAALVKQQLDIALKEKEEEFREIMSLTNPTVRQHLLSGTGGFADDCDAASVHLKAAALPRQANKIILPITDMKETEVYAPSFKNGEKVVLIRHPHGGIFEIPELTVNNNSKSAKAVMNNAIDAIGINPKVAAKLSGADFDGDTAIVIPNDSGKIKTAATIKALQEFNPKISYPLPKGAKPMTEAAKERKMGEVSNLITDMTIKGANLEEITRAVKHSMVVIDAVKHNLDDKTSYQDNGIAQLAAKYQRSARGGASTIISQAKSTVYIPDRRELTPDPETGERRFEPTGKTTTNKKGEVVDRLVRTTRMEQTPDARTLSSGREVEELYAAYANRLKALANEARKEALKTEPIRRSPSAAKTYSEEVDTLDAKLAVAARNQPLERQAQIIANSVTDRKKAANPSMDKDEIKKTKFMALSTARSRLKAEKSEIEISDKEWDAIQNGAVSPSKLSDILRVSNMNRVKQLATPRTETKVMTASKISRAKSLLNSGNTLAEVAQQLGVSVSALSKAIQ